jgi:hypothetical protein
MPRRHDQVCSGGSQCTRTRAAGAGLGCSAFLAQILSLLLPILVDKLAAMLRSCDCLPYNQAGGTQRNIVLERGMLTAVSSIEPFNQYNKFSFFIAFVILPPILFPLAHTSARTGTPLREQSFHSSRPASFRGPSGSAEKCLTFFVNHV